MSTPEPSCPRRNPPHKGSQKTCTSTREDFADVHISDKISKEDVPPSSGYEPEAERTSTNSSTPESCKTSGSSTGSSQKKNARAAGPNDERCLLTNLRDAIETCHLVADTTPSDILMKLEYAWGLGHGQLSLNTRHNLFFLRADWHRLFDDGRWMLIPDVTVLQLLHRVTIDEAPRDRSQIDLEKTFGSAHFSYHFLPMPGLKGPICRFKDPDNLRNHSTHSYPFTTLGPLVSHVKPQYVVVNTAQKLLQRPGTIVDLGRNDTYAERVKLILDLYDRWRKLSISDDSTGGNRSGDADQPPSEHPPDAISGKDQSNDNDQNSGDEVSSPPGSKRERQLQNEDVSL